MSERKEVETREVGYRWHITLDREVRIANAASKQYPDKINLHAALEGHEETRDAAISALEAARAALEKATAEKPAEPVAPAPAAPAETPVAVSTEVTMQQ